MSAPVQTEGRIRRLARSRALLGSLVVTVATALAVSTVGYVVLTKSVTVSQDGRDQTVSTMAGTVEEVLAAEGIEVGSHDVVAPPSTRPSATAPGSRFATAAR